MGVCNVELYPFRHFTLGIRSDSIVLREMFVFLRKGKCFSFRLLMMVFLKLENALFLCFVYVG